MSGYSVLVSDFGDGFSWAAGKVSITGYQEWTVLLLLTTVLKPYQLKSSKV